MTIAYNQRDKTIKRKGGERDIGRLTPCMRQCGRSKSELIGKFASNHQHKQSDHNLNLESSNRWRRFLNNLQTTKLKLEVNRLSTIQARKFSNQFSGKPNSTKRERYLSRNMLGSGFINRTDQSTARELCSFTVALH